MARPPKGQKSKADIIREGLKSDPDLGPTELAEKLNEQHKKELGGREIKPVDVSQAKTKDKKTSGNASAVIKRGRGPAKPKAATATDGLGNLVTQIESLVAAFGAEKVKGAVDFVQKG